MKKSRRNVCLCGATESFAEAEQRFQQHVENVLYICSINALGIIIDVMKTTTNTNRNEMKWKKKRTHTKSSMWELIRARSHKSDYRETERAPREVNAQDKVNRNVYLVDLGSSTYSSDHYRPIMQSHSTHIETVVSGGNWLTQPYLSDGVNLIHLQYLLSKKLMRILSSIVSFARLGHFECSIHLTRII